MIIIQRIGKKIKVESSLSDEGVPSEVIYLGEQKVYSRASSSFQPYLSCELEECGCRRNPFIWVNSKKKVLYFEVPKCASSSIKLDGNLSMNLENSLLSLLNKFSWKSLHQILVFVGQGGERMVRNQVERFLERIQVLEVDGQTFFQATCDEDRFTMVHLQKQSALKLFDGFLKVAIVRDPYSRILSNFKMFASQGFRRKQLENLMRKSFNPLSFEDFLQILLNHKNHHWTPQVDYLPFLEGNVNVDYLIKLEELCHYRKKVKDLLGFNYKIEENKTKSISYKDFFKNKSKEVVKIEDYYSRDFASLSYSHSFLI